MTDLAAQLKGVITQLERNQQQDIRNSAQIYGVAAQAVELNHQLLQDPSGAKVNQLAPVTEAALKRRFKTATAAAAALAQERGIKLRGRLRWVQVVAAWNQSAETAPLSGAPLTESINHNDQTEILVRLERIERMQIEIVKMLNILTEKSS